MTICKLGSTDNLQLSSIEVSIPNEALQSVWSDDYRKSWGMKLQYATSAEELLQGYLAEILLTSFADTNFSIPFSHGMGIISDELYESLRRSCGLYHQKSDSDSAECSQSLEAYEQLAAPEVILHC